MYIHNYMTEHYVFVCIHIHCMHSLLHIYILLPQWCVLCGSGMSEIVCTVYTEYVAIVV